MKRLSILIAALAVCAASANSSDTIMGILMESMFNHSDSSPKLKAILTEYEWFSAYSPESGCYIDYYINNEGEVYASDHSFLSYFLNGLHYTSTYGGVISIPGEVTHDGKAYKVTGVDCFYKSKVTEVRIPATVAHVAGFFQCDRLEKISLPWNAGSICGVVDCPKLSSIELPDDIRIDEGSFRYTGLTGIAFSKSEPEMWIGTGDDTFRDNAFLKNINLDNVSYIGEGSFKNCAGLEEITFPPSVDKVGEEAFRDCTGLRRIRFENADIVLDAGFTGCPNIELIECPTETPVKISASKFRDIDRSKCTVVVPEGSVETYRADPEWGQFRIVGSGSGVGEVADAGGLPVEVEAVAGGIRVTGGTPAAVRVIGIDGTVAAALTVCGEQTVALPAGVYIVAAGGRASRVAVR